MYIYIFFLNKTIHKYLSIVILYIFQCNFNYVTGKCSPMLYALKMNAEQMNIHIKTEIKEEMDSFESEIKVEENVHFQGYRRDQTNFDKNTNFPQYCIKTELDQNICLPVYCVKPELDQNTSSPEYCIKTEIDKNICLPEYLIKAELKEYEDFPTFKIKKETEENFDPSNFHIDSKFKKNIDFPKFKTKENTGTSNFIIETNSKEVKKRIK